MNALIRFLPKYLYALCSSLYLFSFGALKSRHRYLIFKIASHFGLKLKTVEKKITSVSISELIGSQYSIELHELNVEGGNVSILELLILSQLAKSRQPKYVFEIGTFDGRTTLNLAANSPSDVHVYTLDLPKEQAKQSAHALAPGEIAFVEKEKSGARFLSTRYADKISQLYGDSATFDFSPYFGRVDYIFVDGSHAYEYVVNDTLRAKQLLSPNGGLIVWHDYQPDWPGVITALNESQLKDPFFSNLRHVEGTSLVVLETNSSRTKTT